MKPRVLATGQIMGTDNQALRELGKRLEKCFKPNNIEVSLPIPDRKTVGLIVYFKLYEPNTPDQTQLMEAVQ